jgi:DNA-binding transcriptional MerR regulator
MRLTIGEVAERTGLAPTTIRYYERIGLVPAPERVNGRRSYRPDELDRLRWIRLAQAADLTLAEIGELLEGLEASGPPDPRWRERARSHLPAVRNLVERAREFERALRNRIEGRTVPRSRSTADADDWRSW